MKILITGANGQLGSELKQYSKMPGMNFIYTDIDALDLSDKASRENFLLKEKPDWIVNCAAYTAVDKAEEQQQLAFLLNEKVPHALAQYCNQNECRLIHISTDYVFSGKHHRPLNEDDPTDPKSVYGKSKLAGEAAVLACERAIIIRTSWLYSSYGNNFVKSMIRLMQEREELKVVFDQIGTPTYAADLATAIVTILKSPIEKFVPGIYHFSNEGIASWYDFAVEIKQIINSNCQVLPIETKDYPLPAARPAYAVLNKEKIKTSYGISIPHWKNSLQTCINEMK